MQNLHMLHLRILVLVQVADGHISALPCICHCDRPPDAGVCARDERHLHVEGFT